MGTPDIVGVPFFGLEEGYCETPKACLSAALPPLVCLSRPMEPRQWLQTAASWVKWPTHG